MKPNRVFLIRHGQSHGNADKKVYEKVPDWKIPLTEAGWNQAKEAGNVLANQYKLAHNAAVYYSPFLRTVETWHGIKTAFPNNMFIEKEDPRIREQEWGHLRKAEETHLIDKQREEYGHFFYQLPDGESGADVYDRASGFLSTIYRDFAKPDYPKDVLLVLHGYTLRVLLMRWLHWTVEEFHTIKNPPNCYIAELNFINDHFKLVTPLEKEP